MSETMEQLWQGHLDEKSFSNSQRIPVSAATATGQESLARPSPSGLPSLKKKCGQVEQGS